MALSGRCYCGQTQLSAKGPVLTSAYCHCADCKRWTGAPLPAFAALPESALTVSPDVEEVTNPSGVSRRNCPACGSPLTARFPYLPDQVYIPLGVLDQADSLQPELHCHGGDALPWLHLDDGIPRAPGTGSDVLRKAKG